MRFKSLSKNFGPILSSVILMIVTQSALAQSNDDLNCDQAITTLDINYCASQEGAVADKIMRRYLIASYSQYKHDPNTVKAIKTSQQTWKTYKNSNCDAVHTSWNTGSIRGLMSINCHTRMTKQRTYELWLNYLTFMDSTPPMLPEPLLD